MLGSFIRKTAPVWVGLLYCLPLFGAETKEKVVSLSTQDGWALSAVYMPAQEEKKTVVLLHDLNKNKESFTSFKSALAKEGFGYLALDLRGHGQSLGGGEARKFAREGVDNQFNKMTRDVDAALKFLDKKGVSLQETVLLGSGLGANVAAKSSTFWPDVPMVALISPTTNVRDVLSIPAMRLYRGDVLIAAGAADKKMFLEASVLRNVAFLSAGEGKVTFLTAYDLTSHEMLDKYLTTLTLQWLKNPHKPDVLPDTPTPSEESTDGEEELLVAPSSTEEALVPSVLGGI